MAEAPASPGVRRAVAATPLGDFAVATRTGAVVEVQLPGTHRVRAGAGQDPLLRRAVAAVGELAAGREAPLPPLDPRGSAFQLAVWAALAEVPAGEVVTYGELAALAGYPGAARAVGSAMRANPLPLFIPCHRVVAASGLGGYGGGLALKRALLAAEGVEVGEQRSGAAVA